MPKRIDEHELKQIEIHISAYSDGVGISTLESVLAANGIVLNRRTLLRRLNRLIDDRRIVVIGVRKGSRYRLAGGIRADSTITEEETYETNIPLSEASRDILTYVRQPIQGRDPVGYQRDFLLSYSPNKTFYLDPDLVAHLHDIGKPQEPALAAGIFARQVLGRLLIDLSWASSRLEGNTYSMLETERLIAFGQETEGKSAFETQMILNHKQAIEFLVESAEETGFNRFTILNLHAILADNLLPTPDACGRLRSIPVGIGRSVYTPLTTPQLLDEYFQRFLEKASAITEPFEQAFFALVHLPYLQAFEDINKRVSRLSCNIPLIRHNLCPLSFIDVPKQAFVESILGVYEINRVDLLRDLFVWAFERSVKRYLVIRQEVGEPDPFRLRYRGALLEIVGAVVRQAEPDAMQYVVDWTKRKIPADDRDQFISMAEKELISLHKGNIARYHLRPSEFDKWKKVKQ